MLVGGDVGGKAPKEPFSFAKKNVKALLYSRRLTFPHAYHHSSTTAHLPRPLCLAARRTPSSPSPQAHVSGRVKASEGWEELSASTSSHDDREHYTCTPRATRISKIHKVGAFG